MDEKRKREVELLKQLQRQMREGDSTPYGLPAVCAAVLVRRARVAHAAGHRYPRRSTKASLQRVCIRYVNRIAGKKRRGRRGPAVDVVTIQHWGNTPTRAATKLRDAWVHDPKTGASVRLELWDAANEKDGYYVRPMFQWPEPEPSPRVSIRLPRSDGGLFGRANELTALDCAWGDSKTRVVTITAFGGTGKTALVQRWLQNVANERWRGAQRVLAWSFHSQGSDRMISADSFIEDALRWFGETLDPAVTSRWEQGERLAAVVCREPTILILDGIEPMQFPTGDAAAGRLRDPALLALLTSLAIDNNGLCIVTSRVPLSDLAEFAAVLHEDLRQLDSPAAAKLLRSFALHGPDEEFANAAVQFCGHALTLTLVGSFLRNAHAGDIRAWREVRPLRDTADAAAQARRVMQAYRRWLGSRPELAILQLLGLFDRPATAAEISVLRDLPPIDGFSERLPRSLAEWRAAVHILRDARLLFEADDMLPDALDAHPLVREYFGQTLREENELAWRAAHARLYEHLAASVSDQPDNLPELIRLYEAVGHGREAGRPEEVFGEVYLRRIQRLERFYAFRTLGITTIALTCLSGFFERRWTTVTAGLSTDSAARVLNECSIYLRATGRLREASEAAEEAVRLRVQQADAVENEAERRRAEERVATNAMTLSEICESFGELQQAKRWAEFSIRYADNSASPLWRESTRARFGTVLHQLGDLEAARLLLDEADRITAVANPEHPRLFSLRGFQYHDLLLDLGETAEVLRRADANLEYAEQRSNPLDRLFAHLALGRAHFELAQSDNDPAAHLRDASTHADAALDVLNAVTAQHHRVRVLMLATAIARVRENYEQAKTMLRQASDLAARYELHLLAIDCDIERARHLLDQQLRDPARLLVPSLEARILACGYRRRAPEIASLRTRTSDSP